MEKKVRATDRGETRQRVRIRALVGRERATAERKVGRTGASSAMDVGDRDARRSSRSGARGVRRRRDADDDGRGRGRLTMRRMRAARLIAWACAMAIAGWDRAWTVRGCDAAGVTLLGAGATFPASVYHEAINAYEQTIANVSLSYRAMGSGKGLCRIKNATTECSDSEGYNEVDFACSDALIDAASYSAYPDLQMYPVVAGAVALVYNLPNSSAAPLRVNANALLGIFLGNITHWDDPALVAMNPLLSLPNEAIKLTVRGDSSGTTEVWTGALSSMNSTFATEVGTSKLPNWSSVLGGAVTTREGGLGVASFVRVTNFSLGYAVLADADAVGVSIAGYVHNGETDAVYPNTDSISKAVKAKGLQFGNNGDDAHRLTATIAPALETGAWPFTTYSYVVLRTGINGFTMVDRLRNGATCQNVKQTVEFWRWFLSSEQSSRIASQYGFVSLRDELGALVLARLVADVHCAGVIAAESAASVEVSRTVSSITSPAALNNPLRTIQALHEAHNASSTLNVTELTTPRDALSNIITDGGMAIGIDLVGTPLAILLRLPFFQLEMRAAVNKNVLQLGSGGTALALDKHAAALIVSGVARTWGHSEIVRLNPFLNGVTTPIVLVNLDNATEDILYKSLVSQFQAANSSFTLAEPDLSASTYVEAAATVVEKQNSLALLPNDVILDFTRYLDSSGSVSELSPVALDVYLRSSYTGDECTGQAFANLYATLSLLEWMVTNEDVQSIISGMGVTPAFASTPAGSRTFLENIRDVTCESVSILDPQAQSTSSSLGISPMVLALSIGLGILGLSAVSVFGGSVARSFFVQAILNHYKRSHAPSDAEVTIVVTDVQASTKLWQQASVHMNRALSVHDKIIRQSILQTFGYEVLTEGDSFTVAFHSATDAVRFAILVQERMQTYAWDSPFSKVCGSIYADCDEALMKQNSECDRGRNANNLLLQAMTTTHIIRENEEEDYEETVFSEERRRGQEKAMNIQAPIGSRARTSKAPSINGLRVRIGIHKGFCQSQYHPTTHRKQYFKGAVTIAHAVSDCATGGQTVISGDTMAAIMGEGQDSVRNFHALHMGRHQMALNKKELDLFGKISADNVVQVDEESAKSVQVDEAFIFNADGNRARWRLSEVQDVTEEGSAEMNLAYRYTQNAKTAFLKNLLNKHAMLGEAALVQAELVQIVPKSLATRLALFSNLRTVRQLEPSYFDSPGLDDMQITVVYTYIDSLKELTVALKEVMDESIALLTAAVRSTLAVCHGYECRESHGEFLLAFHSPSDAYMWSLLAQSTFMKMDWPSLLLAHKGGRRMRNGRRDVFVGLRVGIGICSGKCIDIRPCVRTGRSEYFGHVLNFAARVARSAMGGQILTDYDTLHTAIEEGYRPEFCHDLGTYRFKGIKNPTRIVQISDPALALRSFEEIGAIKVSEPIGLEKLSLRSPEAEDVNTTCLLLCSANSSLLDTVKNVVAGVQAANCQHLNDPWYALIEQKSNQVIDVVALTSLPDILSRLGQLNSKGRIRKHYLIISDELDDFDVIDACRQVRRTLNLFMQPEIAVYSTLLGEHTRDELGVDVLLPPPVGGLRERSTSRSSFVDEESDSDDEEDKIRFAQALEHFIIGGMGNEGLKREQIERQHRATASPSGRDSPGPRELWPLTGPHEKAPGTLSSIDMLTNALEAAATKSFAVDITRQIVFTTRLAAQCGIGKSTSVLPESEWITRIGKVVERAGQGIIKQPWTESIKGSLISEAMADEEFIDAVHTVLRIGENFAFVLVTLR